MPITIPVGSTISVSGGTAKTYSSNGVQVKGGVNLVDVSATDFRTRPSIVARYNQPVLQPDGSYSKAKMTIARTAPQILASGKTVFNVVRCEIELHPEAEATVLDEMKGIGVNLLIDAELDTFWSVGNISL